MALPHVSSIPLATAALAFDVTYGAKQQGRRGVQAKKRGLVAAAAAICEQAHAGQLDKGGKPYVQHVRRVASYTSTRQASIQAAALLHDVFEDSRLTRAELAARGIPDDVLSIVQLLTRRPDVPDDEYYRRIRANGGALEVKLADLADNTDPRRLAQLGPRDRARLARKYAAAYAALGVDPADGAERRRLSLNRSLPN